MDIFWDAFVRFLEGLGFTSLEAFHNLSDRQMGADGPLGIDVPAPHISTSMRAWGMDETPSFATNKEGVSLDKKSSVILCNTHLP